MTKKQETCQKLNFVTTSNYSTKICFNHLISRSNSNIVGCLSTNSMRNSIIIKSADWIFHVFIVIII